MRIPVKKPSYTEDYYNTNWLELHGCVKEINKCCGFPLIVSLVIIHFPLQNLTLRYCAYLLKAVSELFLSRTLACTNFKQHNHHIVQMLVLCLLPPLWTLTRSLSLTQETTTSVTTCGTMYSKNPLLSTKWMKGKNLRPFTVCDSMKICSLNKAFYIFLWPPVCERKRGSQSSEEFPSVSSTTIITSLFIF